MPRFLDVVERVGNRLPDPVSLFALAALGVVAASHIAAGVAVVHPATGDAVAVVDLATRDGLRRMLTEAVPTFVAFPPLGTVLAAMLGVGVAERSGLVGAALRAFVAAVPRGALSLALAFAGVEASAAADAGLVVLPPLGAAIFAAVGRHPLAGLACAFAGVSGGFSANLILTALDPLLAGLTEAAARLVDPTATVPATCNWLFMVASTLLVAGVVALVTERVIVPRFGAWTGEAPPLDPLSARERRGLLAAAVAFVAVVALAAALTLPADAVLRDASGGLGPFHKALVPFLLLAFLAPGVAYGVVAGTVRDDRDVGHMMGAAMAQMGPYVAMAFAAAQFIAWFGWSNLGFVLAVETAGVVERTGLGGLPFLLALVAFTAGMNLLTASASAKWAVLAPVFVPMAILLGHPPEVAQAAYRVGDSVTNIVTPLLPYMPILVGFARRWVPDAGTGTVIAAMVPYSLGLGIAWTLLLSIWTAAGLPFGV